MTKFILGLVVGSLVTIVSLSLFTGLLSARAERHLIADWRLVKPGMERKEVIDMLGKPSLALNVGDGFPYWAERSVPADYSETHGLVVFALPTLPGPQLLLVYLDKEDRVSFVSSTAS